MSVQPAGTKFIPAATTPSMRLASRSPACGSLAASSCQAATACAASSEGWVGSAAPEVEVVSIRRVSPGRVDGDAGPQPRTVPELRPDPFEMVTFEARPDRPYDERSAATVMHPNRSLVCSFDRAFVAAALREVLELHRQRLATNAELTGARSAPRGRP